MSTPNLSNILDRPVSAIEAPRPLVPGTYLTVITGLPRYDKSSRKNTDFVEFTHKLISAEGDVDVDDLKEYLTDKNTGDLRPLQGETIKNVYYLTETSAYRLKEFLEHFGFDVESDSHTMREMCEETANAQVYITVKHEYDKGPDNKPDMSRPPRARITGTASAGV